MVKHTQTILRQHLKNCLSVLDHFVGLSLKGLNKHLQNEFYDIKKLFEKEMGSLYLHLFQRRIKAYQTSMMEFYKGGSKAYQTSTKAYQTSMM